MSVPVTPNSPPQRFSGMFSVGTHSYEPLGSVDEGEEQALQQHIEIDEDLEMFIHGYKLSVPGKVMFNALSVASGGILLIASRWFPKLRLGVSYSPCPLGQATHVYVENQWAEGSIFKVEEAPYFGTMKEAFPKEIEKPPPVSSAHELLSSVRYFEYRYIRFIFNPIDKEFVPNDIWRDVQWQKGAPVAMEGIRLQELIGRRKVLFGENALKILEKSTFQLLVDEVLHPFFMFQIGSMILWSLDNYYYYATCIFIISAISIIATLYETKQNMRKLQKFSKFSCPVRVWRFNSWITVDSSDLVPGDLFEISPRSMPVLPADGVLLAGDCILNESMLTGESVPVSKSPINDAELASLDFEKEDPASISSMSRFFLFSGTKVIRSRSSNHSSAYTPNQSNSAIDVLSHSTSHLGGAVAMVVRTGFNTTKGNLIRSMLFPKPNKFKFYRDSFRFIGVLSIIAGLGFLASFYNFYVRGVSWGTIVVRALDLITIVVPPALPATMAIGTSFAISRLKKGKIFCISPPRVNICGKIDLMCFDKTGTLTMEGLDVLGFRFTVPEFTKTDLDAINEDDQIKSPTDSVAPNVCRFSRLYTSLAEVLPRAISRPPSPPLDDSRFETVHSAVSGVSLNYATIPNHPNAESEFDYPLIICAMATCHSIKVVHGELVGDPMDLKMFEFTDWVITEGSLQSGGPLVNMTLVRPPKAPPNMPPVESFSQLGLVRTFEFMSSLRRMAVIVKRYRHEHDVHSDSIGSPVDESDYEAYVKGAPEVMRSICDAESIPTNYDSQLRYYAHHGYRVIAIAHRKLDSIKSDFGIRQIRRSEIERDLKFLGFIIFENKLKPGTSAVVKALHQASIRQVMVTGDNVLTSVSVSRECGLVNPNARLYVPRFIHGSPIDPDAVITWENVDGGSSKVDATTYEEIHFDEQPLRSPRLNDSQVRTAGSRLKSTSGNEYYLAITGDVLSWMLDFATEESLQKMMVKTQIFARMSPDQKHFLVERFQELGYCVGFTGDGSNDCGALKNADIGLSLSEAEASVAAPFTSQSTDLSCVLRVIREGRAALVTSFSCFKYMALYSLIQFTTVSILYAQGNNLGDLQYMYIDLFIIIPIAVFMGRSGPHPTLSPRRPTASLVSKRVLTSLIGQIMIQCALQFYIFYWIRSAEWYKEGERSEDEEDANYPSYENTVLFFLSSFQYMIVAIVYNEGAPYRENMTKNVPFMLTILALWGFTMYMLFFPAEWALNSLDLLSLPSEAQFKLFALVLVNLFLSWACEVWVFNWLSKWIESVWWYAKSRRREVDDRELDMDGSGPLDRKSWIKRTRWKEKGKWYKLIQDDLDRSR